MLPTFDHEEERAVFLDALEESLRPLMRVVFKYGVTYQELMEVARALYVYGVRDRLEEKGRSASATSLALMSGMTKREIVDLFNRRESRARSKALANKRLGQLSLILGRWHDDPQFSTPYGAPLDLSLEKASTSRTFDDLLEVSGVELTREEALEALSANRCVEFHPQGFVRCVSRGVFPKGKDLARIAHLARLGKSINSTYVHNLLRSQDEPSYFEMSLVSDFPLSQFGRNSVLRQVRDDGQEFINGFDRWISSKQQDFESPNGERYGVAAYFFKFQSESEDIAYMHRLAKEGQSVGES